MGLLDNRTALVTGAGRGIGSAVARLFASEGARVVVHYNHSRDSAHALAAEIGGIALQADLTQPEQANRLAQEAMAAFGQINILINNAATFEQGRLFVEDDWESYRREMDGVLGATFHITRAIAPRMIERGYGRIVNFGATLIQRPAPRNAPHITAKAAVLGLTRALARELGPHGVTVNIVHPGMTLTDFSQSLPIEQRDRIAAITPLRRIAQPEDAARAALLFASDYAAFITSAQLAPDGGLSVF